VDDSRDAGKHHEPTKAKTQERRESRTSEQVEDGDAFSIERAFSEEVATCAAQWSDAGPKKRLRLLLDAFFGCGARLSSEAVAELIVSARLLALEAGGVDHSTPRLLRRAALAEERLADRLAAVRDSFGSDITWAELESELPAIVSEDPEVLWAPTILAALEALLLLGARTLPAYDMSDRAHEDLRIVSGRAREDLRRLATELDLSRPSRRRKAKVQAERLADARGVLAMITDPDGYGGTARLALRLVKKCRTESAARRVLETTPEWAGLYSLRMTRDLAVKKGIRPGSRNLALILHALAAFRWVPGRRGRVSERNVAAALLLVWRDAVSRGVDAGHRSLSRKELARRAIALRRGAESVVRESTRPARAASFRREESSLPHGMRPSSFAVDAGNSLAAREGSTPKGVIKNDDLLDHERGRRPAPRRTPDHAPVALPGDRAPVREAEPRALPVRRSRPRGVHAGEDVHLDRRGDRQPQGRRGGRVRKPP